MTKFSTKEDINDIFIIDEAGETEFTPEQIENFQKKPVLVGTFDEEGKFFGSIVNGYTEPGTTSVFIFPEPLLKAAKVNSAYRKIAEELEDLTSLSMARGKDIEKKRFLVELEEGLSNKLDNIVKDQGISRNLLINLLVEYFLKNPDKLMTEFLTKK